MVVESEGLKVDASTRDQIYYKAMFSDTRLLRMTGDDSGLGK